MTKTNPPLWSFALLLVAGSAACVGYSDNLLFTTSEATLTLSSTQSIDDMLKNGVLSRTQSTEHVNRVEVHWTGVEHISETLFISDRISMLKPLEDVLERITARNVVISNPHILHEDAGQSNSGDGAPGSINITLAKFTELEIFRCGGGFSLRATDAYGNTEHSSTSLAWLVASCCERPNER